MGKSDSPRTGTLAAIYTFTCCSLVESKVPNCCTITKTPKNLKLFGSPFLLIILSLEFKFHQTTIFKPSVKDMSFIVIHQ